jgi:hypothetical protein
MGEGWDVLLGKRVLGSDLGPKLNSSGGPGSIEIDVTTWSATSTKVLQNSAPLLTKLIE